MSKEQKFFICKHCGNFAGMIAFSGAPMTCCGEKMTEVVPNTTEAAGEKHIPTVKLEGDILTVNVGSVDHPMSEEHSIEWVYVQTENGGQRRKLYPGAKPCASFALNGEKPLAVFAYCNLHGLWKADL
ncbi:MAG: desulfoferrodoxin [Clostridia bacterium]|nr:desulfoferrodoxin [Clostridia bacterium]MBQ1436059.1 desulfoferrodoxin [Clostridia bacterium]MBQ4248814.1 desulfoferrodoxin [Clostridia bacterium]